jgi:hypothetical protein
LYALWAFLFFLRFFVLVQKLLENPADIFQLTIILYRLIADFFCV